MRTYHVEPFNPDIGEGEATSKGAAIIAKQMLELLNRGGRGGWEFESYQTIQVAVRPGCLGIFGGGRTVFYGMLVFSRDDQAAAPS